LVTLLITSIYLSFNGNMDEGTTFYQRGDDTSFSVKNEFLLKEKLCCLDFSGVITDQNFNRNSAFRSKKLINDYAFHFKSRSDNELFQRSSFLLPENTLCILYNSHIYLYLKKLLI
jgi:hypothetical protein